MYGPLLLEQALSDVPLFGKKKANISAVIEKTLRSNPSAADVKTERPSHLSIYPETLHGHSIAASLRTMRDVAGQKALKQKKGSATTDYDAENGAVGEVADKIADLSVSQEGPRSCRQLHEDLLSVLPQANWLNPEAQSDIDHAMLLRAKERYLFDPARNRAVVSDDLWLRYLWDWIAGRLSHVFARTLMSGCGLTCHRCRGRCRGWRHETSPLRSQLHGCGYDLGQ